MASLPSLVVNLALNSVEFVSGLTKAQYETKKAVEDIKHSIDGIGHAITEVAGLIGVGLGVHAFEEMIKGALEAEVALQHLGARAGLTGSQLSSLIEPARLAHTDLETVAQASAKLSKALLNFSDDGAKATIVLKGLGLRSEEVASLLAKPQEGLLKVAHLLDTLPEGGTKAGVQLLILGRAGGATAAVMEELAKKTELAARRTQEEIDAAVELDHRFVQLSLRTEDLKTSFANALVDPINGVLDAFAKLTTGSNDVKSALTQLRNDGTIQEWARNSALVIGTVVESLVFLGRTVAAVGSSFKAVALDAIVLLHEAGEQVAFGAAASIVPISPEHKKAIEARDKAVNEADQKYADLIKVNATKITDALRASFAQQDAVSKAIADAPANADINDRRAAAANKAAVDAEAKAKAANEKRLRALLDAGNQKGDPARAILEGQIKEQERAIALQRDLLNTQEQFLRAYYDQDLITVESYYDSLNAAREEALRNTVTAYDAEISAAKVYRDTKAKTQADKEKANNTILEAEDKQRKAIVDSTNQEKLLSLERTKAFQKYRDELDSIQAQLLIVNSRTAEAAAIQFDIANRSAVAKADLRGDEATKRAIAALREQTILQAGLNDITKQYDLILGDVAIQTGYINLAQSTGRISEIEALQKQSDLNRAMIPYLEQAAQAYQLIAEKSGQAFDIQKAAQMRLELEKLKTQTDLLADTFNKTFGDAFSSAISDVVTGAKSVKDAFNDMVKQITKSIADLASKGLASSLFGQEGPLSGIGKGLSQIFGGGGNAKGVDTGVAATAAAKAATAAEQTLTSAANLTSSATALTVGANSLESAGLSLNGAGTTLDAAGISLDTAGVSLDTAATGLIAAAEALTASAASEGASGAASGIGGIAGLFGGGGFSGIGTGPFTFAGGTDYAPGGLSLVGEHGPEIINVPKGAQVIPNEVLMQKRSERAITINQTVNVLPGANTQSARQAAAMLRDATSRSIRDR